MEGKAARLYKFCLLRESIYIANQIPINGMNQSCGRKPFFRGYIPSQELVQIRDFQLPHLRRQRMDPTQRRMQNDHSRRNTPRSKVCLRCIILVGGPPGRGPLECQRYIAREGQVAADALENGEDFAICFLGKAAAEGELPVEEAVVCFRAGAHGLVFAKNAAARSLEVEARAGFVIEVAGGAVESCEDRLLGGLAEIG